MGKSLVDALLEPSAWPQPVAELTRIETHISWVFLTGEFAYKIKKPLALEFLDFSTLELRRHWCEEEVRLNRRWAPGLYAGVVAITGTGTAPVVGGGGPAIEYAVKMRQFPQSALLSEQLRAGELLDADVVELAEMIADRHANAPAVTAERFGALPAIQKPMDENFLYLKPWLAADDYACFEAWTHTELQQCRALLDARRRGGYVRRCHGDLHLRNLVRLDDGIVAFDCIEFSEELRTLDVISDLTFLSMDLIASGRDDLAWTLLNRYLELTGDYDGMRLYGLYHVYHCMIRAKVAAILAGERNDDRDRQADLEAMHHYCDVARAWIERASPALIVMHGLSGSGKTWVSSRLAADLTAVRARSDIERKRLCGLDELAATDSPPGAGRYGAAASKAPYSRLLEIAGALLAAGHRVILDATFLRSDDRSNARAVAAARGLPVVIVAVEAADDWLGASVRRRQVQGTDASEGDAGVLEYQRRLVEPVNDVSEGPVIRFRNGPGADTATLAKAVGSLLKAE